MHIHPTIDAIIKSTPTGQMIPDNVLLVNQFLSKHKLVNKTKVKQDITTDDIRSQLFRKK